ncbi:helix-turn-helix domain-containing protein [Actinokineospora soli]|uniref:Helix-turn-helix domain-containing protein n=1 Tax=Actinokineospora soli TaxID=1048753 RepID=A0ABW2TGQ3_9PSEU
MTPTDPVVARIQLGLLLRSLRMGRNIATMAAGRVIGMSNATISRVETGKQGIKQEDLITLIDHYRAGESAVAEVLRLHAATKGRRRGNPYLDTVPHWFRRFLAMEAEATHIAIYENEVVTGLLQTDAYARMLMQARTPEASRTEIDRQVEQRMERQEVLAEGPHLEVIMLETVLHRVIGDDEIMAGQLKKLAWLSMRGNVDLRIIPFRPVPTQDDDEAFVVPRGFTLLRLPEQGTLLYLEDFNGAIYPEELPVIQQYNHAFDRLRKAAADVETSREMITTMQKEYE